MTASYFYILHIAPFRDDKCWVTVVTEHFGILRVLYRSSSSLYLHTFCRYYASFKFLPSKVCVIDRVEYLPADQVRLAHKRLYCGLYANELLEKLCMSGQHDRTYFDLYAFLVKQLAAKEIAIDPILRHFELSVLQHLGLVADWEIDYRAQMPIEPQLQYVFTAPEGFAQAEVGSQYPTVAGEIVLSLKDMQAWGEIEVRQALKHVNRQLLDYALNQQPLKSREFLR